MEKCKIDTVGFGLTVLEAMTAGCPVITSNISSLPEVAGDAGLLIDPLDAQDIACAMRSVLEDEQQRVRMIVEGQVRAAQFSWWQTASMTRDIYLDMGHSSNNFNFNFKS